MQIAHLYINEKSKTVIEQSIIEHLNGTAAYAESFGAAFCEPLCAKAIAQAHDIGKYSDAFQRRIRGANIQVDHSTAGARELYRKHESALEILAAYCVMGHHGGLPDGGSKSQHQSFSGTLYYRLKDSIIPEYSDYLNEVQINIPKAPQTWIPNKDNKGFSIAFLTRMLFSCLVDADWLDTERFMKNGSVKRGEFDSTDTLLEKLTKYTKRFETSIREIDKKRTALHEDCIKKAVQGRGLFSLTAPTGSGKTLASLSFALNHAVYNHMERVIYVVPYNTIIEQTAAVFEEILGKNQVVQHHSNIEYDDEDARRFATENWNAPVIVTSNVQFFESLFAAKPSKCRKLHNIANSVIIFDEAQMVPLPYLRPCVYAIRELVNNCNCSAVLATATQSSLDELFSSLQIVEINSAPQQMYDDFKRVTYVMESEAFSNENLVAALSQHQSVLCIVNTRKKAQEIASQIPDCYHLSTTMYPAHRAKILSEIREKLKNNQKCRLISTSLMEAGVDVDFPVVYREIAGLDSVIQAAGRCNREGNNRSEDSIVHVFSFLESNPTAEIKRRISAFEHAQRNHADIASLQTIESYFKELRYLIGEDGQDAKSIVQRFNYGIENAFSFPFASVAEEFYLIENGQKTILVENAETTELCETLRYGKPTRSELRRIQQYSINVYPQDFENLCQYGQLDVLNNGIAILSEQYYDAKFGISLKPSGGQAIFG